MAGRWSFLLGLCCLEFAHCKILLFWPVDNSSETQETVRANIQHVNDLGIDHDVILAHYYGSPQDWDKNWYAEHVTQSLTGRGYKFLFSTEGLRGWKVGEALRVRLAFGQ